MVFLCINTVHSAEQSWKVRDDMSREKAIGNLIHAIRWNDMPTKEALEMAIEALKQKTGHWILVTNGRGGHECDQCHEYAPSYQSGGEYLSKHCPNCGAKMESEVSE